MEVPYDIPDSWEWVKLKEIALVKSSKRVLQKDYAKSGIPFYRSKEIGNLHRNEDIITELFITDEHYQTLQDSYGVPKQGDILITSVGSIGNTWICDERKFYYKDGNITQICSNEYFNSYFIERCIHSPFFWEQVTSTVSGTAYSALTIIKLNNILFPLPPLSEQKRIVEQIERALEKVDAYSESYNKLQELDKSFPDKLKKSILQYAMQGKLVPQDPNDEPVEVLLEKIQTEKQKLYEEGKLKKKDLAEIVVTKGDDNSPYGKIPKSWRINSLSSVANIYTGNSINAIEKKTYFTGVTGSNYIATKDVNFDGSIDYNNGIKIPEDYLSKFKISPASSVLLCLEGGSAGRKIGLLEQEVCFGNKLCSLSFYTGENKFLYYFLQSPQFLSDFQDSKSGIIGGVSVKNLGVITIPMPPQKEQERISSEVEQLFQKVNQL
ncbi:restriction endonuclease subunit S [Streptococcus suis]|nr:restriction endonuclease subunit S [Streptococcus suis]